jgi:hypothetical protein
MCHICLSGDTLVTTKYQGVKRLDELKVSQEILTCKKNGGLQKWTQFYLWGHVERDFVAEFIRFKFDEDGLELKISNQHLLFVADKDGRKKIAKKAG